MGYRWVIWDWNGTLLDDAWLSVEVINLLRAHRRLPLIDLHRYQEVFGFPLRDYCVRLGFAPGDFEALSAEFSRAYEGRRDECQLQPGARRVLEVVQRAGLGQAVLSAHQRPLLEQVVAHYRLREYFAAVKGLDNPYAEGKVELGRRLLEELACPGAQALLVGDTDHDFEVAQGMGVDCALFASGHQYLGRLERCGAPLVERLDQVLELLGIAPSARLATGSR